jgi:peptide chain release factor 1
MFDRLDQLEARYEELGLQLSDPNIVNDQENYRKVSKQHRDMEPTIEKFREYRKLHTAVADAKAMLADADMRDMAQAELDDLEPKLATVEEELKVLLLPKDPNDDKNIVLELRAGTGGDEASLFVAEVFRMYLRFAEQHKWKVEILSETESDVGGLKDVTAIIEGQNVYAQMKYESGVHRVQRVPATETQGRTSGSRRSRHQNRKERSAHRHVLLLRTRRPVREHDLLGHPHHASAHQHCRLLPGRKVADQESRKGHARPPFPPLRS